MSATWLQALRAFMARGSGGGGGGSTSTAAAPATLAARQRVFDEVFAAHLGRSARTQMPLQPGGLVVLREVRWLLLRDGTSTDKAALLEHVLRAYEQASEAAAARAAATARQKMRRPGPSVSPPVDLTAPAPATQPRQRSAQRHPAPHHRASTPRPATAADADAEQQDVGAQQLLLLEQVQCLVEAKVADVPLSAQHYRYPMRSPLLATVSPELPLLLLDELRAQLPPHSMSSVQPRAPAAVAAAEEEWEARVDCGVGLAAAGHVREVLDLCGEDGRLFRAVVRRVAARRGDGWRRAWALADAVPLTRLLTEVTATTPAADAELEWLRGVLEAVDVWHRAAAAEQARRAAAEDTRADVVASDGRDDGDDDDGSAYVWVDRVRRFAASPSSVGGTAARGLAPASPLALQLIMDTCFAVCPASRWREAVGAALELAERNAEEHVVTVGRLMAMLQAARQPWLVLLFFYGDPRALQRAGSRRDGTWRASDASVRAAVEAHLHAIAAGDRLTDATGAMLNPRDVRHAAVFNHAMVALAATDHVAEAVRFYDAMPRAVINAHTHWSLLQVFLRNPVHHDVLRSAHNYSHCMRAVRHLARLWAANQTDEGVAGEGASAQALPSQDPSHEPVAPSRFTRDQAAVWESMALWAALRRDDATVQLCAAHAPASSRYTRPIALLSAAADGSGGASWAAVQAQMQQISAAPQTTLKELTLATAVLAVFYSSSPQAEVAKLVDDVVDSMARLVGDSQPSMDEALVLLADYTSSLRRRRRGSAMTPEDEQAALESVPAKERVLANTMDLARPRATATSGRGDSTTLGLDDDAALWRTMVRVATSVAAKRRLSTARAAPTFLAAGAPADIAIDLLPT